MLAVSSLTRAFYANNGMSQTIDFRHKHATLFTDRRCLGNIQRRTAMTTSVRTPLTTAEIARIRDFINNRFGDVGECSFATLRAIANDALNQIIAGNRLAANIGIQKLGPDGERDMRAKLRKLGIELAD